MGGFSIDARTIEFNPSGDRGEECGNGFNNRGLSRPIGTNERYEFSLTNLKRNLPEGLKVSVVHIDVLYFEHTLCPSSGY
jgi:hypothetical protein